MYFSSGQVGLNCIVIPVVECLEPVNGLRQCAVELCSGEMKTFVAGVTNEEEFLELLHAKESDSGFFLESKEGLG